MLPGQPSRRGRAPEGASVHPPVAGELRATVVNGVTYVAGDVNGDKAIDLHVALTNHPALVAGDFVL